MLISKIETLNRALVKQRLLLSCADDNLNFVTRFLVAKKLGKAAWLEGKVTWLHAMLSSLAGASFKLIALWNTLTDEERQSSLIKLRVCVRDDLNISKQMLVVLKSQFLFKPGDIGFGFEIREAEKAIEVKSEIFKALIGADFKKYVPGAYKIGELVEDILVHTEKIKQNPLVSQQNLNEFVDELGVKDSMPYRRLAGQILIFGREN